ncbi:MAG: hypothetical protein K6F58_04175 [Bacteroidales bacterium]|nr:hypothetical protein [Bacteroidales bacterium]
MKALFIACSRAYNEEVIKILELFGQKGFTRWTDVGGRGSKDGLPHLGTHAWPDINHAILTFVEDDATAARILEALRSRDSRSPELGLRAFMWNIENYC